MTRARKFSSRPGSTWQGRLLRPGLRVMERLRLPAKVALVVASLLLPLVLLTLMAMQNLLHTRQLAVREQEGVRISELVLPVALQLNRHRDLTFRVLDGEIKAEAPRTEARRDLLAALQALDTAVSDGRLSYSLADEWQPVATQIRALAAGQHPDKPYEAAQLHSLAGQALQRLQLLNGERSDLILTPEARSYHLVDVLINSALPTLDTASRLRGLGSVLLLGKDAVHPPAAMAEIVSQSRMVANDVADIQRKFAALERAGDQMPGSWPQAMARLLEMGSLAEAAFVNGKPVDAAGFQEVGNSAIALANAMLGDTHRRLAQELLRQQQTAEYDLLLAAAAAAAGLLLLAYLMLVFTINVHGTLGALRKGTDAIAGGDLAHRVKLRGRDELCEIGEVVDAMSQRLSNMVAEIRNSASMVNLTGQQVSQGSSRLANRTDEQASSLRHSVGAINELSTAMNQNAEAARQLDALTERLAAQAEQSNEAMTDTVQSMQQMQLASARVAEVVTVIDDVAFQTSMLSMNAAIEAAKAGDAGRGFAVVAVEVRQLAQRCADSAEEIRRLIGDASAHAEISGDKLGRMSGTLGTIVDGVHEVSTQLRAIATSSTQQSEGLQEVTRTVGNLDEITRENAALVEESSTASHALVERATKLREAVATMRLRQGSADEALAMVHGAQAHIEQVGREQALHDFHDSAGRFIDRDLYLFAIDREGTVCALGANPALVGKPVLAVPSLQAGFAENAWAVADGGGGWMSYRTRSPVSGELVDKESYITRIDDYTLIGCGVHREIDAQADRAVPRASAWEKERHIPA